MAFEYHKIIINTSAVRPHLREFLHTDIESTGYRSIVVNQAKKTNDRLRDHRDDHIVTGCLLTLFLTCEHLAMVLVVNGSINVFFILYFYVNLTNDVRGVPEK